MCIRNLSGVELMADVISSAFFDWFGDFEPRLASERLLSLAFGWHHVNMPLAMIYASYQIV